MSCQSLSLPSPFPVSNNLCQFQKGSGVSVSDATGCEVPCLDPSLAADQAQALFPSLDDETIWTAQAAIVSSCDECIYGPVEATLRTFVHDLKSVCCIEDSCLVGIINAILCNPVLNYRARFIEAQQAIRQVQLQNEDILRAHSQARASADAANTNICQIVNAVKAAIFAIPQDGGQGSQTRCCLAACLQNLCQQPAGVAPPVTLAIPCPCPPISCEALANACVVIKVSCGGCNPAGSAVTCDESFDCPQCDDLAGGGNTLIGGLEFPSRCLLPTSASYSARQGNNCQSLDKAVVLTFRAAQRCATGELGVIA